MQQVFSARKLGWAVFSNQEQSAFVLISHVFFIISNRCHVSNVLSDQGIRYLSEDRCAISKVQSELDIPQLLMYWQTKKGYGSR